MTTDVAPQASAAEAFQNHESRLQEAENALHVLAEAFPHLRDALGVARLPHQFTEDEMRGLQFTPNTGSIESLEKANDELNAKLDLLLSRLGPTSTPSSGDILPPPHDDIIPQ